VACEAELLFLARPVRAVIVAVMSAFAQPRGLNPLQVGGLLVQENLPDWE